MASGGQSKESETASDDFTDWSDFPAGHVKDKIKGKFDGSEPGDYCAMLVRVKNLISGYKIIKGPKV